MAILMAISGELSVFLFLSLFLTVVTMATNEPEHENRDAEESGANEDEDTGAQVAPIVRLEEVAVTTGEEDEDAVLDLKSLPLKPSSERKPPSISAGKSSLQSAQRPSSRPMSSDPRQRLAEQQRKVSRDPTTSRMIPKQSAPTSKHQMMSKPAPKRPPQRDMDDRRPLKKKKPMSEDAKALSMIRKMFNFGSFFGPSRPVISSRVIQETKSLLENKIKNSNQPMKRPAPTNSSGDRNVSQENEKSCVWHARDLADGELKDELFCIRFASIENCKAFMQKFNEVVESEVEKEESKDASDTAGLLEKLTVEETKREEKPVEKVKTEVEAEEKKESEPERADDVKKTEEAAPST